jgi:hypothetical protein
MHEPCVHSNNIITQFYRPWKVFKNALPSCLQIMLGDVIKEEYGIIMQRRCWSSKLMAS